MKEKRCENHLPLNEKKEISKGKQLLQTDSFLSICSETTSIRLNIRISNESFLIIFQFIHPTKLCHITIRVANIVTFEKTI